MPSINLSNLFLCYWHKNPPCRLSVGGTNRNESFPNLYFICYNNSQEASVGGMIAGAAAGAVKGSHIGIAFGEPAGAIAGTIPCAIVGGIIGLLGGNKVGSEIDRR